MSMPPSYEPYEPDFISVINDIDHESVEPDHDPQPLEDDSAAPPRRGAAPFLAGERHVVIQMGHCFRKTGATGTVREQEFASKVAPMIQTKLQALGIRATVIGADAAVPRSDIFVALHTDGSTNTSRRGASVGYPPSDAESKRLAQAWKRAHQRNGYNGGFLNDNYTTNLSSYYGFKKSVADAEFLAEHGTTTNATDRELLFSDLNRWAVAHVEAIAEYLGLPNPNPNPGPAGPDTTEVSLAALPVLRRGTRGHHVFILQGVLNAWAIQGGFPPMDEDGVFGSGTETSLKGFQKGVGLDQTGVTDSYTWEKLLGPRG